MTIIELTTDNNLYMINILMKNVNLLISALFDNHLNSVINQRQYLIALWQTRTMGNLITVLMSTLYLFYSKNTSRHQKAS